jgi:ubiquinone/menaquinone biosynthesis C-methylase UbiE
MDGTNEKYVFGYTEAHIKILQQRKFSQHCQFFIPYLKPGMRVLDCGCGPGNLSIGFAKAVAPGEVIAIDISREQLNIAEENAKKAQVNNIKFQLADATNLPFADNSFDFVYSQTLLSHFKDPLQVINEQKRVVNNGGIIAARDVYRCDELLIHPVTDTLKQALRIYYQALIDSVGNLEIGIKLAEYFAKAGLINVTQALMCENFPAKFIADFYGNIILELPYTKKMLQTGKITLSQLKSYQQAWTDFGNTPGAYYGLIWADAVGKKTWGHS